MMRSKAWVFVVFGLAGALAASAGTLDLAVRGRVPEYAIVRAADALPSVTYAAEELRDFTEKMTGVRLPIVTDDQPMPAKAIVLGRVREATGVALPRAASDDSFRLLAKPPHLFVTGGKRGVLYGVYELL